MAIRDQRANEALVEAASDVLECALRSAGPGSPDRSVVGFFWLNRLQTALEASGVTFSRDGNKTVRAETIHEKELRLMEETR